MDREEAINIVRKNIPHLGLGATEMTEALGVLIPELRESEDEMIRRTLVEYFGTGVKADFVRGVPIQKIRDWLEKQEQKPLSPDEKMNHPLYLEGFDVGREVGKVEAEQKPISSCDIVPYIDDSIAALQDMWREEKVAFDWDDMHEMIEDVARHFYQKEQKPAEWNDTDMKEARDSLISVCRDWERGEQTTLIPLAAVRARYFLEHLTEPKPAWSEEDEKMLADTIFKLAGFMGNEKNIDWLKSLRPSWKPSEEQMAVLLNAEGLMRANNYKENAKILAELYQELKKL